MTTPADAIPSRETHVFRHNAMATSWEIRLVAADAQEARHAATEVFREISRLEGLLSRFIEGSDIWCINHMAAGAQRRIDEETHACLLQAMAWQEWTEDAFNPGLAVVMDQMRDGDREAAELSLRQETVGSLIIDEQDAMVACAEPGYRLDLGAIGKGYALDRARSILADWGFSEALLLAGGSSLLGLGKPWEVRLAGDSFRQIISLPNLAVGSSGHSVQGEHILDPRRGQGRSLHHRSWALCESAASADALSTAAMTMTEEEIRACLARLDFPAAVILEVRQENGLRPVILEKEDGWTSLFGLKK